MSLRSGGGVKICGTRSRADLEVALEAGADEIGIICHPERQTRNTVDVRTAVELAAAAPDTVTTVLIPRLTDAEGVIELAEVVAPDRLQLGETEDPDVLAAVIRARVVPEVAQVVHVADRSAVGRAQEFAGQADIIHLDSAGDRPGGTGHTHDWTISREVVDAVGGPGTPVILAGGLTPENVAAAIASVRPDGVDVETGIKRVDGTHDPARVKAFVAAARAAFVEYAAAS